MLFTLIPPHGSTRVALFTALSLCVLACQDACSQETGQPKAGQPETEDSTSIALMPSGVQRFSPGGWAAMSVVGVNRSDNDTEEVVSVYLADDPTLQYSKRFWLPAHSKRQTWLSMQVPHTLPQTDSHVTLSMMRIDESEGAERFADNLNGEPILNRSLMLATNEINTGLIADSRQFSAEQESEESKIRGVLYIARDAVVETPLDLPVLYLRSNFIAPTHRSLDELDQLVVAGDHLLNDTMGIESVRQWLHRGGRLWIMLDQTDRSLVDELLGNDVRHSLIDRVELNEFQFDAGNAAASPVIKPETWSSETPVELMRVMTDAKEVAYRINGWPAAIWQSVGEGEVLLTTLGSQGWLHDGEQTTRAYERLSKRFFEPRERASGTEDAMIPLLENGIGYQIPSRSIAAMILGTNVVIVLLAGLWWAQRRQLERMALLIPFAACFSAAALFWIGNRQTQSVPPTVATGQVARVFGNADRIQISTVQAVYSQDENAQALRSNGPTVLLPPEDTGNETRRIRWDDSGRGEWIGATQPPGVVRHYHSSTTKQLSEPLRVQGTFDANGFQASLVGLAAKDCSDVIAVTPNCPSVAIQIDGSSEALTMRAGVSDLLSRGQYLGGSILSDQQRLRQEFLRRVFKDYADNPMAKEPFGKQPSVLIWTNPFDTDIEVDEQFHSQGSALVSIPITFAPPIADTAFRIPATFIQIGPASNQQANSMAYNYATGRWLEELTKPNVTDLLFRFPSALQQMALQQINVTLKINAPSRSVIIRCLSDGKPTKVFETQSPSGTVEFSIDSADVLEQQPGGGWWMQVAVTGVGSQEIEAVQGPMVIDQFEPTPNEFSVARSKSENTTWTIESLHIDAVGRIDASESNLPLQPIQQANLE